MVQIINEKSKEIVYTLRIKGKYTIRVGEQDPDNMNKFKGVQISESATLKVVF